MNNHTTIFLLYNPAYRSQYEFRQLYLGSTIDLKVYSITHWSILIYPYINSQTATTMYTYTYTLFGNREEQRKIIQIKF